jgi:phosphoserine phosphatase RsbU/P
METQNLNDILGRLSEQNFWDQVTPTSSSSDIAQLTNELLGHRDTLLLDETLDSSMQNMASFDALIQRFENLDQRGGSNGNGDYSKMRDDHRNRAVYLVLNGMKKKLEFYQSELQVASRIQQSLLPLDTPQIPGYDFWGECKSCNEVGGDFFHYYKHIGSDWLFLIADVAGKGLPSSLIVSSLQAYVTAEVENKVPLDVLVQNLDHFLISNTTPEKFVTLFIAQLNPEIDTLTYVNAGHNPPMLMRADGEVQSLKTGGPVVGMFDGATRDLGTVQLRSNDTLALYTDGVTEAENPSEQMFGEMRFLDALQRNHSADLQTMIQSIFDTIQDFTQGYPATDDVTMMLVRKH